MNGSENEKKLRSPEKLERERLVQRLLDVTSGLRGAGSTLPPEGQLVELARLAIQLQVGGHWTQQLWAEALGLPTDSRYRRALRGEEPGRDELVAVAREVLRAPRGGGALAELRDTEAWRELHALLEARARARSGQTGRQLESSSFAAGRASSELESLRLTTGYSFVAWARRLRLAPGTYARRLAENDFTEEQLDRARALASASEVTYQRTRQKERAAPVTVEELAAATELVLQLRETTRPIAPPRAAEAAPPEPEPPPTADVDETDLA